MSGGARLRVMTYNIHGLHDDVGALVATVREAAPDVLILQEALRRLRWRSWIADLAHRFGLYYAGGGTPAVASGNVVMTSLRVRARERGSFRYRNGRGAVIVRCSIGRSPFVVAGSHLATEAAPRLLQATELKAALPAASPAEPPVVICGDVNEASTGPAWRLLATGLVDTGGAAGQGGVATFPPFGQRIDAIFVDPRFELLGYQVLDTPRTRAASDHLPVLADLALPVGP